MPHKLTSFLGQDQQPSEHWRGIVLFGRNVASYKFALAKSLIELGQREAEIVRLDELAVPFSRHVCEHITRADRQGTFSRSKFLDACRFFNAGRVTETELVTATELLGFKNVIDAFHTVGAGAVPTQFFIDERNKSTRGIRLTDELVELSKSVNASDLSAEVESRWRLVESAWARQAAGAQSVVLYDAPREILVPALTTPRRPLTEVRPALNGYQKGYCFYCFRAITAGGGAGERCDVDHFLPHSLMARGLPHDLDEVWNLALACTDCNRGPNGKHARLAELRFLERLAVRNEFLIASHHPLRETLILQTGDSPEDRSRFLTRVFATAGDLSPDPGDWMPPDEGEALF